MKGMLHTIVELATARRCVQIGYRKPGEYLATRRIVEPYRLQQSIFGTPMVLGWQLLPAINEPHKWRNYRLDLIDFVEDGQSSFTPRREVTICAGDVEAVQFKPEISASADAAALFKRIASPLDYARYIEAAMMDGRLNTQELGSAKLMQENLHAEEIRAIHGQVFANVLDECCMDGRLSDCEIEQIVKTRKMLKLLGWAPC